MAQRYDDENFEEDGGTFDFDEETVSPTGVIAPPSGAVYREYHGEDFSQYLNDDDDDRPQANPYGWETWQMENSGRPDEGAQSKRRRPKSTAIIREKLGRLLLNTGSGSSRNSVQMAPPQTLNRIYDVSFADCKMGNAVTMVDTPRGPGSDSGIDCRSGFSLETESDLGAQASSSWWDVEASRREEMRSSASAGNLRDHSSAPTDYRRPATEVRLDRIDRKRGEPELPRGQQREPSEPSRATSDGGKRPSNPFRKIYNTLNRRKSANLQQMSYSMDHEDIRL